MREDTLCVKTRLSLIKIIFDKPLSSAMRKTNDFIQLSASDLSNYIACHHLSFLDLSAVEGKIQKPEYRDPLLAILQERGHLFEDEYLQKLKDNGLTVENHFDGSNDSGLSRTIRSMLQGCDVISGDIRSRGLERQGRFS
jgi:hypothetical protein